MGSRYFKNNFEDYVGGTVQIDQEFYNRLITEFVETIWHNVNPDTVVSNRADLYVGQAGKILAIHFFLKQNVLNSMLNCKGSLYVLETISNRGVFEEAGRA